MALNDRVKVWSLDRRVAALVYVRGWRGRLSRVVLRLFAVDIPPSVTVGPGLKLLHVGAGHTVHYRVEIGSDVVLGPGSVLGRGDLRGSGPMSLRIGDDVIVGAGAVVLGSGRRPLTVGDGAVIGANAVVTRDVPPGETWIGNPAAPARRRVPEDAP